MAKIGEVVLPKLRTAVGALKQVTVEPYFFLCLFGSTVRMVTFQGLLMDGACRNLHLYGDEICGDLDSNKEHQKMSIEMGNNLFAGMMLMSSLPAILVAIFVGPWSDKYSRKYPLLMAASGMMLEAIVSATLSFYPSVSPIWYVLASLFSGFSGSIIMIASASFSYISDVSDERSRSARYAFLEFADILSTILGNLIGGQIFKAAGFKAVMVVSPVSFALAILYTAVFVKETKVRPPDQKFSDLMRDLVTVDNIKESYRTCSKKRPGSIRLQIWLLVWALCSHRFVDMGTNAVSFPYARGMYNWNVAEFTQASTYFYMVNAFVTVVIVPLLANKLRLHEAALGLIGMLSLVAKMVLISVAYYEPFFYYAWIGGSIINCTSIAVRARISKLVHNDELGRAFSLVGTCESVTPLLGTLVFVQIYNASAKTFPGMPFALSAVFLLPCLYIFGWMTNLPTISLGDYGKEDEPSPKETPLETYSSNYVPLAEETL